MKVVINERIHEYQPDFDNGWEFSAGDYFKFPVSIGRHACFIKRFARSTKNVTGWALLETLKTKGGPDKGLPRVYDLAGATEGGKEVWYVFFECMKGDTLDRFIAQGGVPDPVRMTNDLFMALDVIHEHGHWFADFCEKNIFRTEEGRHYLIDLDSAPPSSMLPNKEIYASKEYWAFAFTYLMEQVGLSGFRPEDISGVLLNYLQAVLLILRVKTGLTDGIGDYRSTTWAEDLPRLLGERLPQYRTLFRRILEAGNGSPDATDIGAIKEIFMSFVMNKQQVSMKTHPTVDRRTKEMPVIRSFTRDKRVLPQGGAVTLDWEVDKADAVMVCRNEMPYIEVEKGARSITLTERFDGKTRKIIYSIEAVNSNGRVSSVKLPVRVGSERSKPVMLAVSAATVVILLLLVFLISRRPSSGEKKIIPKVAVPALKTETIRIVKKDTVRLVLPPPVVKMDSPVRVVRPPQKKVNALPSYPAQRDTHTIFNVPPPPQEDPRKLERMVQDSTAVVKENYSKGILHLSKRSRLVFFNRSGHRLSDVVLEIIRDAKASPERMILHGILPKAHPVLIDDMPRNQVMSGRVLSIRLFQEKE